MTRRPAKVPASPSPFRPVPGHVVIARAGLWRAASLAVHKSVLLASVGSGYTRLLSNGETAVRGGHWSDLQTDLPYGVGPTGFLMIEEEK